MATIGEVDVIPGYTTIVQGAYVGANNLSQVISVPGYTSLKQLSSHPAKVVTSPYIGVKQGFLSHTPVYNSTVGASAGVAGTTTPISVTVGIVYGETAIAVIAFDGGTTPAVTSITNGGTWKLLVALTEGSERVEVWGTGAGQSLKASSISVAFSGTPTTVSIAVGQYTNVADYGASSSTGSSSASLSNSLTTSYSRSLVVTGFAAQINAAMTATTGSLRTAFTSGTNSVGLFDNSSGSPGAVSVTNAASISSSNLWAAASIELAYGPAETAGFPSGLISVGQGQYIGGGAYYLGESSGFPSFLISVTQASPHGSIAAQNAGFPGFLISVTEPTGNRPAEMVPFPSGLVNQVTELGGSRPAQLVPWPSVYGSPANVIVVTEATYGVKYFVGLSETWPNYTESITAIIDNGEAFYETWPNFTEAISVHGSFHLSLSETWPNFTEAIQTNEPQSQPLSETWPTYSEAIAVQYNAKPHLTETVSLSEALAVQDHRLLSLSSPWSTYTESVAISAGHVVPLSESWGSIGESINVVLTPPGVPLSESWTTYTESLNTMAAYTQALSSPWSTYSEALSVHARHNVSLNEIWNTYTESVNVVDTPTIPLSETWSTYTESINVTQTHVPVSLSSPWTTYTESLVVDHIESVSLSESWSTYTESINTLVQPRVPLAETVSLTEAIAVHAQHNVALAETVNLSESLHVSVPHTLSVSDSWSTYSEAISVRYQAAPLLYETVSLTESLALQSNHFLHLAETVSLSEALRIDVPHTANLSETWSTYTESVNVVAVPTVHLSETWPNFTETLTETAHHNVSLSSPWTTYTESLHVKIPYSANLSETWPNYTESISNVFTNGIPLNESWGSVGESLTVESAHHVSFSETVHLSEALVVDHPHYQALSETWPAWTESISTSIGYPVQLTETWPAIQENVYVTGNVSLHETVPWSESIYLDQGGFYINLAETVPLAEVITVFQGHGPVSIQSYTPANGPITGGTPFIINGSGFVAFTDTLQEYSGLNPIPGTLYSQGTSGTGTITPNNLGVTCAIKAPGDQAGLSWHTTIENMDATINYSSTYSTTSNVNLNYDITVAALRFQIDSGTYFEVSHHIKNGSYIQVVAYSGGIELDRYTYVIAISQQQLRLVRLGSTVQVYVGGVLLVTYQGWSDITATPSFYSGMTTTPYPPSIVPYATVFTNFGLNAVVGFGVTPAQGVTVVTETRIRGVTPAVAEAGLVPITYSGYDGNTAQGDQMFEYLEPQTFLILAAGQAQVSLSGDAAISNPIPGQPGFGQS